MTTSEAEAITAKLSEEALLLEPREFFDGALVGVTDKPCDHWPRQGGMTVAVYDSEKCIEAIMKWHECDYEDALDWFGYNTAGAWQGEGTPLFRSAPPDEDEVPEGHLVHVIPCEGCGERWCTLCETHWADCTCAGLS